MSKENDKLKRVRQKAVKANPMPKPEPQIREVVTKVAGVTFGNRQSIIKKIKVGDPVDLVPEPRNKDDPNAVKVVWHGKHIGYLPATVAAVQKRLSERKMGGHSIANVHEARSFQRDEDGKTIYTLALLIVEYNNSVSDEEARRYLQDHTPVMAELVPQSLIGSLLRFLGLK